MNTGRKLLALLFCATLPATAGEPDLAEEGAALLMPFKASLKQALMEGMQEGPAAAIEICSDKAPEIAASLSVDGITMGRSSHKLRNPENAPPGWPEPVAEPVLVDLGEGRHGYAEPIFIRPLCLTCHGKELAPDVAARIEELYPDDDATGFDVGDLRGVFWVEF